MAFIDPLSHFRTCSASERAQKPKAAATITDQQKHTKFDPYVENLATLRNEVPMVFIPFTIETNGMWGTPALKFFNSVCNSAAKNKKFSQSNFRHRWLRIFSCAIQRCITRDISRKVRAITFPFVPTDDPDVLFIH